MAPPRGPPKPLRATPAPTRVKTEPKAEDARERHETYWEDSMLVDTQVPCESLNIYMSDTLRETPPDEQETLPGLTTEPVIETDAVPLI